MNVGVAGEGRGQLGHWLDTIIQDRPGGGIPYKARLYPPGDKETRGKGPLWCRGLGFGVYRSITRVGLGCTGRAKRPISAKVGCLIVGQLLLTT